MQETGLTLDGPSILMITRKESFQLFKEGTFDDWISDPTPTLSGQSVGDANRAHLHAKLDLWLQGITGDEEDE